jgi:hypothetical protein
VQLFGKHDLLVDVAILLQTNLCEVVECLVDGCAEHESLRNGAPL